MSTPDRSGRSETAPVLTVGVLLLLSGLILLLAGDAFFPSDPAERGLWTSLVGIILILATLGYLLLFAPEHAPAPAPAAAPGLASAPREPARPVPATAVVTPVVVAPAAPSGAMEDPLPPPRPPTVPAAVVVSAAPSVRRAVAMEADRPDPGPTAARSSFPTSIPAAYLQALAADRSSPDPWSEVAPPIAAALPFSPGIRRSGDPAPPWDESSAGSERESPRLELELARLRARVRELEVPLRTSATTVAFPRLTAPATMAKEPPTPPSAVAKGPKGCIACGRGLTATGPAHLCWGCGRTLCSTCYWRFGPGPGLHRCPECMSRAPAGSESISGGRVTAAPDGPAVPLAAATRATRH
jgi:hypothetical protein